MKIVFQGPRCYRFFCARSAAVGLLPHSRDVVAMKVEDDWILTGNSGNVSGVDRLVHVGSGG